MACDTPEAQRWGEGGQTTGNLQTPQDLGLQAGFIQTHRNPLEGTATP